MFWIDNLIKSNLKELGWFKLLTSKPSQSKMSHNSAVDESATSAMILVLHHTIQLIVITIRCRLSQGPSQWLIANLYHLDLWRWDEVFCLNLVQDTSSLSLIYIIGNWFPWLKTAFRIIVVIYVELIISKENQLHLKHSVKVVLKNSMSF